MKLELPDLLGHALICVSFCVSEIARLPAAERLSVARRLCRLVLAAYFSPHHSLFRLCLVLRSDELHMVDSRSLSAWKALDCVVASVMGL